MKKKQESGSENGQKLKRKDYEKELRSLQAELCTLQDWVKHKGLRVIVIFEGRDGAGKGGTIRALTERVSPSDVSASWRFPLLRTARKVSNIPSALHEALSGGRRDRDFRSKLVQPGRR